MSNLIEYLPVIKSKCRGIKIRGMEKEDIEQEIVLAVLAYINKCKEDGVEENLGAVKKTIGRALYRLIKDNITFDNCREKTRDEKLSISRPRSNEVVTPDGKVYDLFDITVGPAEDSLAAFSTKEICAKFRSLLTPTEKTVYDLMLQGYLKPREICEKLHGYSQLNHAKTISNHSAQIRKKFEQFWLEQTGRRIN